MAVLLALNVLNPEAIVVSLNIDRAQATHTIDTQYLATLSSDATPALLDSQSPDITRIGCAGPHTNSAGPAAFNWSDVTAAMSRRARC
jgi:hypothetical protein